MAIPASGVAAIDSTRIWREYTKAVLSLSRIGDVFLVADLVCLLGYRVEASDIDLLCDLKRVVNLDAEIAHRALDLRVAQQLGFIRRFS